ncbi:MAG: LD-carboxypeptidase [Deltaproteobacteria bacterium]|nr:LD-carboxypeptidase [Deltaproteobacteria bacterium]
MRLGRKEIIGFSRIKKGDVFAVVSTSGPVSKRDIKKSVSVFRKNGFELRLLSSVFKRDGYLAGSDEDRFFDLKDALLNEEYKAILFSRGGYGSMRLLSRLSTVKLLSPKPIFGFSDTTALHVFFNRLNWITFHSPNLNGFFNLSSYAKNLFFNIITGKVDFREIRYKAILKLYGGRAEGILIGGNLSMISALSGTRFDIDLRDKILFIEDIGEKPYRIDRMLTQLTLREDVRYLRGIVFGKFTDCGDGLVIKRILSEFSYKIKRPAIYGIDVGHIKNNMILSLGTNYLLHADKKLLIPLERVFL